MKIIVNVVNTPKNDNCPLEHYGDGTAFCGEFSCIVEDCRRFECISFEELMDI